MFKGEAKNQVNDFVQWTLNGIMKPAAISFAIWMGIPLSTTSMILAITMLDRIRWPLHMLPHFLNEVNDSARAMTRI